jgi:hypothetical protein
MVDAARDLHPVAGAENDEVARHHHAETTRENGVDLVKAVRVLRERGTGLIDMASDEIARGLELAPHGGLRENAVD